MVTRQARDVRERVRGIHRWAEFHGTTPGAWRRGRPLPPWVDPTDYGRAKHLYDAPWDRPDEEQAAEQDRARLVEDNTQGEPPT